MLRDTYHYFGVTDYFHDAIRAYFLYGLRPGSFSRSLIIGDKNAISHADHINRRPEVFSECQRMVASLPKCCLGGNYGSWKGYAHSERGINEQMTEAMVHNKLSNPQGCIIQAWIKEHAAEMDKIEK